MFNLDEIRNGLTQREFFLEYMPIVSLTDGHCLGAEALIRWQHDARIVAPNEFMPQAENTPLSGLVTFWVVDTVASEMRAWLQANRDAYISFNVPPEILGRGGLEYVAEKSGLIEQASQILLEITERGIPDLLGVASLNDANRLGVKVALDDVTLLGGANLAILARCNFHAIKLDKSLIDQISPHGPAPEWLDSVTALLKGSQLQVIAEGVETEQQVATLSAANIQAAQGFYFSPPIPAAAFIAFHRGHVQGPSNKLSPS